MDRIDTANRKVTLDAYAATGVSVGYFTDGAPGVVDGTNFNARWCNQVQGELANAITDDGITLDIALDTQLATRISPLKGIKTHATTTGSVTTTHRCAVIASQTSTSSGASSACVAADSCVASGVESLNAASFGSTASATGSANTGTNTCTASQTNAANMAADTCVASGVTSANVAGASNTASGTRSANVAGSGNTASGIDSGTFASGDGVVTGQESAVIASDGGTASGRNAVVMASNGSCEVAGDQCAVIASGVASKAGADDTYLNSAVVATQGAWAKGDISAVMASTSAQTGVSRTRAMLVASRNAELTQSNCLAGGYHAANVPDWDDAAPEAGDNITWRIESDTGDVYCDGSFIDTGADYAELFENLETGAIPHGTIVTRKGARVRAAGPGDRVLGIVSAKPGVLGNAAPMRWAGRYATTEFGGPLWDDVELIRWPMLTEPNPARVAVREVVEAARAERDEYRTAIRGLVVEIESTEAKYREALAKRLAKIEKACAKSDEALAQALAADQACTEPAEICTREGYDGALATAPQPIPDDAIRYTLPQRRESAEYDRKQARAYVPRLTRPEEWTCVGLLGQLRVRVDASVTDAAEFIAPGKNGIGTSAKAPDPASRRIECMEIVSPFDAKRGYGIALVLVG